MSDTQHGSNPKADAKAAKAYAKATRPWYKKKRWIAAIVVGVIIVAAALGSGGGGGGATRGGGSGGGDEVSAAKPVKVGEAVSLEGTTYTVERRGTGERGR
jgi:acyl dehydratase